MPDRRDVWQAEKDGTARVLAKELIEPASGQRHFVGSWRLAGVCAHPHSTCGDDEPEACAKLLACLLAPNLGYTEGGLADRKPWPRRWIAPPSER